MKNRITKLIPILRLGFTLPCLLIAACVLFENKSQNRIGDLDFADAVPLFQESYPLPEKLEWPLESGMEYSSLGNLNPIFLDPQKSPLRYVGAKIDLNLFKGFRFLAQVDDVQENESNHFVSRGHVQGFEDATYLITMLNHQMTGTITIADLGIFRVIFTSEGKYRVSKLNDYDKPESEAPIPLLPGPKLNQLDRAKIAASMGPQSTRQIDLAVYYNALAAANAGGELSLKTLIVAAVDEANDVYVKSGIDITLRLVDTQVVVYTETDTIEKDLANLQNPIDGILDNVQSLRNAANADIVTLVVDTVSQGYAGLGYVMTTLDTSFRSFAYNVIIRDGLTPGWYTLVHEIGHNLGCQHDIKSTKINGAFNYSHGWLFTGKNKVKYKTIMGYGANTRIPYFSNPKLNYQGKPIGSIKANNAQTIQLTAPFVASYKGTDLAATVSVSFPPNNSKFGGNNLLMTASITDEGGLDSVVFNDLNGITVTKIGKITAAPWKYFATGLDSGDHHFFISVYDRGGHISSSDTVTVTLGFHGFGSKWRDIYTGLSGQNGHADTTGSNLTLTSQSKGISGIKDDMQFGYQVFNESARIKTTFNTVTGTAGKSRVGLMVRDSLSSTGIMAFFSIGPDNILTVTSRTSKTGAAIRKTILTEIAFPYHLMVTRKSNRILAFQSTDGITWRYLYKTSLPIKSKVYAGIAMTSGDSTDLDTASISSFAADTTGNSPPTISLTGVIEGADYNTGDSLTLTAGANDLDGLNTIKRVKFLQNNTVLAVDSIKPYTVTVVPATMNETAIRARVFDDVGDSTTVSYTISIVDTNHLVVQAAKDTYVRDGTYSTSNYGSALNLFAENNLSLGKTFRSVLTFSLSGIDTVTKATLRLFGAKSASNEETVQTAIYHYSDTTWIESSRIGLTDATMPNDSFVTVLDTLDVNSVQYGWFDIDVSALVDSLKLDSATAVSFGLKAVNNTEVMSVFSSRSNSGYGLPQLILSRDTTGG
jgi:hypothetical protein